MFEIIFDFGHYITHRLVHTKYLYPYIHKTHHKYKEVLSIHAFHHNAMDLIITNSIPFITSSYILRNLMSNKLIHLILVYKIFLEISGHSGRITNSSCFTQCILLPKLLGISLNVQDHDFHHLKTNCNYSKRFSLFDKLFGTYKKYEVKELKTTNKNVDLKK